MSEILPLSRYAKRGIRYDMTDDQFRAIYAQHDNLASLKRALNKALDCVVNESFIYNRRRKLRLTPYKTNRIDVNDLNSLIASLSGQNLQRAA